MADDMGGEGGGRGQVAGGGTGAVLAGGVMVALEVVDSGQTPWEMFAGLGNDVGAPAAVPTPPPQSTATDDIMSKFEQEAELCFPTLDVATAVLGTTEICVVCESRSKSRKDYTIHFVTGDSKTLWQARRLHKHRFHIPKFPCVVRW